MVLSVKAKHLPGAERSRWAGVEGPWEEGGGLAGIVPKAIRQNSVCRLLYCHSCRFFHP